MKEAAMSFKNALKNLVAHFGAVWALLLYIVIFAAVITGLSLPFVLPVARAFADAGVFETVAKSFGALFGENGWNVMWDGLYSAYDSMIAVFQGNSKVASLTTVFVTVIMIIVFRFFLGLYEIPLATVIDGQMSCNAHYGLGGKFFSTLPTAARYSATKMLFTIASDTVIGLIVYGLSSAIGLNAWLPFVLMLVMATLVSLRFSIVACWAPCVASGDRGVLKGFVRSGKICFKRFGSIYSTYFMSFILIVVVGALITLFTLGVGMIIILPFFASFISYLNATVYYNKSGKRYYIDGAVFTPPSDDKIV